MNRTRLQAGFVGAGNMGQALIAGIANAGIDTTQIGIAEPDAARAQDLQGRFPGVALRTPSELAEQARTLVLAVKPQVLPELAPSLAAAVSNARPLVISVAAGISTRQLAAWLGAKTRIIRAMPNTPALVGAGIAGLFANDYATAADRDTADRLLGAVGTTVWLGNEEQMHAVTATSGSGPAYVFLLIEAMTAAAEKLGLDTATARQLSLATVAGAAQLATDSTETATQLRARVTSPGGTTERAIAVLQEGGFAELLSVAMSASAARSRELGR